MIKFYLGDLSHEIQCNTNSTITEIAGTFDLGTMELEWNECKYAIFPNTPFFISETETNDMWSFIIVQDNVEIVKKTNTIKYLHRLTLSQGIHKINNVIVRNSVFTQPFDYKKKYIKNTIYAVGCIYDQYGTNTGYNNYISVNHNYNTDTFLKTYYPFSFKISEKVSEVVIKISANAVGYDVYGIAPGGHEIYMQNISSRQGALLSQLVFRVINCDNTTDYLEFTLTAPIRDVIFTQSQINWLIGKDVFIKVISSNIAGISSMMPETITRTDGGEQDITLPFVAGMITFEMTANTYNYSLWDVLDILNKQCIKEYNADSLDNYYTMPSKLTGQGLELDSIIAPELVFTNMDLYECVAKTLSYIDAFPVIDENGVLGFQYLNNLSNEEIENLQFGDEKTTLNEQNFTNKISTYYQNGKLKNPITYPSSNFYKFPTTTKYGVPDRNDWYFVLDKPIDYIDSFTVLLNQTTIDIPGLQFDDGFIFDYTGSVYIYFQNFTTGTSIDLNEPMSIDITSSIFPRDVYGQLPVGSASSRTTNQHNSLYYERGDNKIYCGITGNIFLDSRIGDVLQYAIQKAVSYQLGFYDETTQITYVTEQKYTIRFNCVYHPVLDGKVAQESTSNKAEKETIISQNSGSVELNRLGNNLQGVIAKLGNEEKTFTLPITDFKSKVKLGTKLVDELGNNWFINRIQTTFTTDEEKVIVNASFSKNYNAMQQFTSLDQEKRFYDISSQLTTKGYENISEFIYFTNNKDIDVSDYCEKVCWLKIGLQAILNKTFGYTSSDDELSGKISVFNNVGIKTHGKEDVYTYLPPVAYGCGNQICFEMGFKSPLLADNRIEGNGITAWLYTSKDGVADFVNIYGSFLAASTLYYTQYYPEITDELPGTQFFKMYHFYYYKKPNEIFHLNYSLNFLPYWEKTTDALRTPQYKYEQIYFGDKFINENGIIPNTIYELTGKRRNIHLFVGNSLYSIVDNYVLDNSTDLGVVDVVCSISYGETTTTQGNSMYGSIVAKISGNAVNVSQYKSWCLADEDGNVYIAVNRNENSYTTATLGFFTSRYRKI